MTYLAKTLYIAYTELLLKQEKYMKYPYWIEVKTQIRPTVT